MTFVEKYRVKSFSDVKGQDFAIEKLRFFFKSFSGDGKKALILYGPAGTGKTSLAHALSKEVNAEIMEINSSDLRNADQIDKVVRPASEQRSLFNTNKVILVDEVDGIATRDRGGLSALLDIIKTSSVPIIMTANDIWDKKFAQLRQVSEVVPVKQLNYKTIFYLLKDIVIKEKLNVDDESLLRVAIKCNGDVRAGLNDLDVIKEEGEVKALSLNLLNRDEKKDIFTILKEVFKNRFSNDIIRIFDKTDMSLDEILLWLEENIPYEYKDEELWRAFDALSKADVFKGRIIRRQYWRFLVYQNFFLSAGVSAAKLKPKFGFTSYKKPSRILKTWIINQKNAKRKSVVLKYCAFNHISYRKANRDFSMIVNVFKLPEVQKELKFSPEEIKYVSSFGSS
ncbi:hypothetical protein COU61_02905 [Candidatus Pacearchaeota archaeon CG10_big_fil_rev_8_21_14_0_10_35_13]|nr:MAG: hypothetical protein COU61_02905 [Candidatus Pacearchaeota archaeon CG10_big_fil_rev_8_21_14_0_10_35_13]